MPGASFSIIDSTNALQNRSTERLFDLGPPIVSFGDSLASLNDLAFPDRRGAPEDQAILNRLDGRAAADSVPLDTSICGLRSGAKEAGPISFLNRPGRGGQGGVTMGALGLHVLFLILSETAILPVPVAALGRNRLSEHLRRAPRPRSAADVHATTITSGGGLLTGGPLAARANLPALRKDFLRQSPQTGHQLQGLIAHLGHGAGIDCASVRLPAKLGPRPPRRPSPSLPIASGLGRQRVKDRVQFPAGRPNARRGPLETSAPKRLLGEPVLSPQLLHQV